MSSIIVRKPIISESLGSVNLTYPVEGAALDTLYFTVGGAERDFVNIDLSAALVGLLIPAMRAGKNLHLDGPVSDELLYRAQNYIMPLLKIAIHGAADIQVTAKERSVNVLRGEPAVITGLSNGVDSLHAAARHTSDDTPASMKLTHFVFYDVGSHGSWERSQVLSQQRLERSRASARDFGLPLITLVSNLAKFYDLSHQQTHTMRSSAAAFVLSGRAAKYLYASTVPYSAVSVGKVKDLAIIDTILLPLLKSESLECFSVGSDHSRAQKTIAVSEMELAKRHLDVCVMTYPNCSTCWKCARTIATLEAIGKEGDFADRFDYSKFSKIRDRYYAHIWASSPDNPLIYDIKALLKKRGAVPSRKQKTLAMLGSTIQRMTALGILPQGKRVYSRIVGFSLDR